MTALLPTLRNRVSIAIVVLFSLSLVLGPPRPASAHGQPSNFNVVGWSGGPVWANYDELSPLPYSASPRNTDWPIGAIFWNNANVNKVKDALFPYYSAGAGNTEHLDLFTNFPNTSSEDQDEDRGVKTPDVGSGCSRYDLHFRVYAPYPADMFYYTGYGYFVVATTHYDINEGCPGAVFGYSETAELLLGTAATNLGYPVGPNLAPMYNAICYPNACQDGDHIWYNNGNATYISIP